MNAEGGELSERVNWLLGSGMGRGVLMLDPFRKKQTTGVGGITGGARHLSV